VSAPAVGAHDAPMLDVGGDVGALVVLLPGPTPSGELEARPAGVADGPGARFHTGVHRRAVGDGRGGDGVWAAVFPDVHDGTYTLLRPDGSALATVAVPGGRVTQLDLR
jgi:hypothetical protein